MADRQKYYLDFNATAPIPQAVTTAVTPYIGTNFGNPSSKFNPFGRDAAAAVNTARNQIAELLGLTSQEIVFTSGGTESCYAAFLGRMLGIVRSGEEANSGGGSGAGAQGGRVIISAVEHPAVIEAARLSSQLFGIEVVEVGVDRNGQIDLKQLEAALTDDTWLVSIMAANNETGILLPLADVVRLASARGIPVHTDATNFVGKLPCNFTELGVSFVSMSAHKIGGLKGVGVLGVVGGGERCSCVADNKHEKDRDLSAIRWLPVLRGGGQESGRRGGTENVAGIVSLGAAATLKLDELRSGFSAKLQTQRDHFEKLLKGRLPGTVEINGEAVERLPNTSSVLFSEVVATEFIATLSERGVYVSAGSACKTASVEISHVLKAMSVPFASALGVVRFSFGELYSEKELSTLVETVANAVEANRCENLKLVGNKRR